MDENEFSYEEYLLDIDRYVEDFETRIKEINSEIQEMISNKKISPDIQIEGRIKSYKSLIKNIMNNKNIQDCFGLKIITENESDNRRIADKLKELYNIIRIKNHTLIPTTSYNATHIVVVPDDESIKSTFMEIQLCTKEQERKNNEGMTAHDIYKLVAKNKSNYEEAKNATIERHSMLLDLSPDKRKQYLPTYYVVENDEIKILDEEETIRKMFPTVYKEKSMAVTKTENNSYKDSLKVSEEDLGKEVEVKEQEEQSNEIIVETKQNEEEIEQA